MKKLRTWFIMVAIGFMAYSCAVSCGPGPGQSTAPVTYPSGYTLDKQDEKIPAK
jgi:hypothetical protein